MRLIYLITIYIIFSMFTISYADNFKLGYVDVSKIFTTAKPALSLQEALKIKFAPDEKNLKSLNDDLLLLQNNIKQLEAKNINTNNKLSNSDKAQLNKLIEQYQKQQIIFEQKYANFQRIMQKSQEIASALLLSKVNNILKDISDRGNYDLILTSNQLVYAKAKYDVTDQVIERLKTIDGSKLVKELETADKPK